MEMKNQPSSSPHGISKRMLALFMTVIMIVSAVPCFSFSSAAASPKNIYAYIKGSELHENSGVIIKNTDYTLAPGITETELTTNNSSMDNQTISYICTISPSSNTKIVAGYKDNNPGSVGLQTVSRQAAAYEKATGENVVAGINADFFNMNNGEALGATVKDGVVYHQANGEPYFAVLKDGTCVIRDASVPLDDVKEAVGGHAIVVSDGQLRDISYDGYLTNKYTHSAVGIKADGTVVAYVTHGMNAPLSCGEGYYEIGAKLIAMGCVSVLCLDGGGSATFDTQREGTDSLVCRNSPKDGGERNVSTSLLFVSTAMPSGTFDHASVTPNDELYTPNSEIQFAASGVDSSGAAVDLPADLSWTLAADSAAMGIIDAATGKFTANSTTGTVTVNAISGGAVVGSAAIEIVSPDAITFDNAEISLAFNAESDLGLNVKHNGRTVNVKNGDILWTLETDTSDPANLDAEGNPKVMGSFDGNLFTSSKTQTVTGTITATSAYNSEMKGSVKAVIGRLPTVMMDFEDKTDGEGNTIKAEDYWSVSRVMFDTDAGKIIATYGADGTLTPGNSATTKLVTGHYSNDNYNPSIANSRNGNESAEIVSIGDGEPVRFGNSSLKLNYDFTASNGIEGACAGFSDSSLQIEGNPTAIGMWVYAPEWTPNLWLRIRVRKGDGAVSTLNFTIAATSDSDGYHPNGIDWTGWKYVTASLKGLQGPFSLIGGETIRVMYYRTNGCYYADGTPLEDGLNEHRSKCKGSVYIDNLQFIYGSNIDDTENPVIDSIQINDTALADGDTIDTNKVILKSYFHDVPGQYATGIDFSTVYLFVDGVDVTSADSCRVLSGDSMLRYDDLILLNGTHTLKVLVRDGFGNETTMTRTINIDGDIDTASAYFEAEQGKTPDLGSSFAVDMKTKKVEDIKSVTASVAVSKEFKNYAVIGNDNFDVAYTYDETTGIIKLTATKKDGVEITGEAGLAQITCDVPYNLAYGTDYTYTVQAGSIEYATEQDANLAKTFSAKKVAIPVTAGLTIDIPDTLVGTQASLCVRDKNGDIVKYAKIYNKDGSLVGSTNYVTGYLDVSNIYAMNMSVFSLYAECNGQYSFITNGQSFLPGANADGTPYSISSNATSDTASSKCISWLANPLCTTNKAVIQVAAKSEYDANGESAFKSFNGKSTLRTFAGSNNASVNRMVRINSAVATDLEPEVEYVYRVGDGETWSDAQSFTLKYAGTDTNFFIVGDAQGEDTTNSDKIIENLKTAGIDFNFGVQTGDILNNAALYSDWTTASNVFKNIGSTDLLHAIGNHEQFGDTNMEISSLLYGLNDARHFSTEYGNVYAASIAFTDSKTQLTEDLKWLVDDAAKSDAQWKLLFTHVPAYYTNPTAEARLMNELLPAAAQQAGIDIVFSGHDHSYARTEALTNGEIDNENGITYYICGSTGEKSYGITENNFKYAMTSGDFNALYLTVSTTDTNITVNTYELDGTLFDSFSKTKSIACGKEAHSYAYADGRLECSACGYNIPVGTYSGLVTDKETGKNILLASGARKTGWYIEGESVYYFAKNGLGSLATLDSYTQTTCTVRGAKYYSHPDAPDTYKILDLKAQGHEYETKVTDGIERQVCKKCCWVLKNIADCTFNAKKTVYVYNGAAKLPGITASFGGEKLYSNRDYKTITAANYSNNVEPGTATITIYAKEQFSGDHIEQRGSYYGSTTVNFTIISTDVAQNEIILSSSVMAYTGSPLTPSVKINGMTQGKDFTVTYSNNTNAGTATVTVTGIGACKGTATKNFKIYDSNIASFAVSGISETYLETGSAIKPTVSIKGLTANKDYAVTYSNNTKAGTATVTIKGIGDYKGSVKKTFKILSRSVSAYTVTGIKASYVATGSAIKPKVKLTGLTANQDYKVTYSNNTKVGTATVTIKGIGAYTGTVKKTFKIYASTKLVSPAKLKAKTSNSTISLSWSAVKGAKSYVVYRYVPSSKTYTRLGVTTTTSFKKSGFSSNRNYYFAVRAAKDTSGSITGYRSSNVKIKTGTVVVSALSITAKKTLAKAASFTVNTKVSPATAINKTLKWTTSNKSVATVSSKGVVTAKSAGTCVITATSANGIKDTCVITVTDTKTLAVGATATLKAALKTSSSKVTRTSSNKAVATVTSAGVVKGISTGSCTITVANAAGEKTYFYITVNGKATIAEKSSAVLTAAFDSGKTSWSTSNANVAAVSSSGKVTGAAAGVCKITAKSSSGASAYYTLTVNSAKTVDIDATCTLTPFFTSGKVTYTSSDAAIATVSSKGKVTPVALGTCRITAASSNGEKVYYDVTVKLPDYATAFNLNRDYLVLTQNGSAALTYAYAPEKINYSDVTWTSSDAAVATVDAQGLVTKTGDGSCTVTATISGGLSDTCAVFTKVGVYLDESYLYVIAPENNITSIAYAQGSFDDDEDWVTAQGTAFVGANAKLELANFKDNTAYTFRFAFDDGSVSFYTVTTETTDYNEKLAAFPSVYLNGPISDLTVEKNSVTVDAVYSDSKQTFTSFASIKFQGNYSLNYDKKNLNIKFYKDEGLEKKQKVDFGWGKQSKYTLKANYTDYTQSRNIVAANIWSDVVATRENLNAQLAASPNNGAIDGYPVRMYFNGEYVGLYSMNIAKDDYMFGMDGDETTKEAIISSNNALPENLFAAPMSLAPGAAWEIEACSTGDDDYSQYKWAEDSMNEFVNFVINNDGEAFVNGLGNYADVNALIDYVVTSIYLCCYDNMSNNMIWATYDGKIWFPTLYDLDGTYGYRGGSGNANLATDRAIPVKNENGVFVSMNNEGCGDNQLLLKMLNNYGDQIKARYTQLRSSVLSVDSVLGRITGFMEQVPTTLYEQEKELWPKSPSFRYNYLSRVEKFMTARQALCDELFLNK